MSFVRIFLLFGMVAILGCDSGAPAPVDPDTEADGLVQEVKAALESIGEEGEGGGGYAEVRGVLSGLEEVDAAKAASILKELDALDALTDPDEKKAKALEIASKL